MAIDLKQNGWFPSQIAWAEKIAQHGPSISDGAMSYEGGNQQVMVIQVNWAAIMQATADLLGTNVYNTHSGQLDRTLPMQHPVWDWLYCSRISSYKGLVPTSKGVHPATVSGVVSTQYQFAELTCLFTQPKYRLLNDPTLEWLYGVAGGQRQEYQRYLQGYPQPKTEGIRIPANSLYFVETSAPGTAKNGLTGATVSNSGPALNGNFTSDWLAILGKADIVKTWKKVPAHGLLSNRGTDSPVNLDAALQTVNSVPLFGKPVGTLKFEGYKLTPLESAYPPELDLQARDAVGMPNLLFDVDLAWSFWDPPFDANANGGNPTRGHNLLPFRGAAAEGQGVFNNLWYLGGGSKSTDAGAGDPFLFGFQNHKTIFYMVD